MIMDTGFVVVPNTNLIGNDTPNRVTLSIVLLSGFITKWKETDPIRIIITTDNGSKVPLSSNTTEKYYPNNINIVNDEIVWTKSSTDDVSNIQRKWTFTHHLEIFIKLKLKT